MTSHSWHEVDSVDTNLTQTSANQRYQGALTSQLEPLQINQIHDWQLEIETIEGEPLVGATVTLSGGMPAHQHGFPTVPTVTEVGDGRYLTSGMKFQMSGQWQMVFDIEVNGEYDQLVFDFMVP
ncbi:MAG: FixH family protein [Ardenticatenaceae bacterium]